jgi:Protein of unknown function (DUF2971)
MWEHARIMDDWTEADQALKAYRSDVESLIRRDLADASDAATYQTTIYHYTDTRGVLGILQTGRLWFTERAHLNDPVEIKYGLDVAHELFAIAANNRSETIPKDATLHLKGEHNCGLAAYGFWIASLSLNGDDLGQWRNYADEGRGVCLGFSAQSLDMIRLATLIPNTPNSLRFPVNYDKDALCRRLQAHIELGLDLLEKANLVSRDSYYQPYGRALLYDQECFAILNNGFYANSLLHKHAAYEHEQEYRLLVSGLRDRISRCDHHRLRERKGELVGYLDLPIPGWKQHGVLTHIRLGPAASDKDAGFHSRASLCASAICAGVMRLAISSRCSSDLRYLFPCAADKLSHMCART